MSRLFATLILAPILTSASSRTLASLPKAQIVATAVDHSGAVYVTGTISSADLPVTPGAFQTSYHATTCPGPQWSFSCPDGFVVKFNAAGQLVYATYLGGDGSDLPAAIAVDEAGNAFVAGATFSSNFPLTDNRLADNSPVGGFVVKINAFGTGLVYSTRLPGVGGASAIAVDGLHRAHIAGYATGPGLPVTPGAIQTEFHGAAGYADAVVLKLSARGDQVLFATYLGGSSEDTIGGIALDFEGNVYVAGSTTSVDFPFTSRAVDTRPPGKNGFADAFVAKLNSAGTSLLYAARPSGSCNDEPAALTVDQAGRAFLTGWTCSIDYPVTAGALQRDIGLISSIAFLTVLSADGSSLDYSTYFGGSQSSAGTGIALDSESRALVTGWTLDADFPTSPGALRCNTTARVLNQGFLVRLDPAKPAGRFATYVDIPGTANPNVAALDGGLMLVAGNGADGSQIVVIDSERSTDMRLQCVASAASGWVSAIAPGELVTLYGTGPAQPQQATLNASGTVGTELAGVRVLFEGIPTPILSVSDDELRAVVPFGLAGRSTARVQVERGTAITEPIEVPMANLVPGIFRSGTTNRAVVLNEDQSINSATNPAKRGSVITFWATGLGLMEPAVSDGSVASSQKLSRTIAPVSVSFFGWPAEVLYAGSAPGFVAGTVQINTRIPEQMRSFAYPVDLVLSSGVTYAPVGVTVNIQ